MVVLLNFLITSSADDYTHTYHERCWNRQGRWVALRTLFGSLLLHIWQVEDWITKETQVVGICKLVSYSNKKWGPCGLDCSQEITSSHSTFITAENIQEDVFSLHREFAFFVGLKRRLKHRSGKNKHDVVLVKSLLW